MKAPVSEWYIQLVHILPCDTHDIVALDYNLAPLLHSARWIMVDTTFKPVHGDTTSGRLLYGHLKLTNVGQQPLSLFAFSDKNQQALSVVVSGVIKRIVHHLEHIVTVSLML
jgi:hypothetical protein